MSFCWWVLSESSVVWQPFGVYKMLGFYFLSSWQFFNLFGAIRAPNPMLV